MNEQVINSKFIYSSKCHSANDKWRSIRPAWCDNVFSTKWYIVLYIEQLLVQQSLLNFVLFEYQIWSYRNQMHNNSAFDWERHIIEHATRQYQIKWQKENCFDFASHGGNQSERPEYRSISTHAQSATKIPRDDYYIAICYCQKQYSYSEKFRTL